MAASSDTGGYTCINEALPGNCPFYLNKMASAVNFRTSLHRHSRTQRFREQKHWRSPQRFPYNVMQMMQGSF